MIDIMIDAHTLILSFLGLTMKAIVPLIGSTVVKSWEAVNFYYPPNLLYTV